MSFGFLGIDTIEYSCEKCHMNFRVYWAELSDAIKLTEMHCPNRNCEGKITFEDADEDADLEKLFTQIGFVPILDSVSDVP